VSKLRSVLTANIRKALDQIGGPYAFSWQVAAISYFWASFISVGFDRVRFGTPATGWLFASTVSHLILIALAIPIRLFLLPKLKVAPAPFTVLGIFAFLGLVRSFLMGEFAVNLNLANTQDFGYRQIGALISITSGLSATTILVSAIAKRQKALADLIAQRRQLTSIQNQAEELFEQKRAEVHEILDESIKPSLQEIQNALSRNPLNETQGTDRTADLISELIDQRLRPISDELHRPDAFGRTDNEWREIKYPIVRRTTKVSLESLVSPFLVPLVMFATTVAGSIYYVKALAIPLALLIYLPAFIVLWLGKTLLPEKLTLNVWLAWPLSVIAHFGAGFPSFFLISLISPYFPGLDRQLYVAVVGFGFTATLIALFRALESERIQLETQFKAANDEAAKILATLNQRIWVYRKNIAQLLHGSVQAALTAANVRLRQSDFSSEDLVKVKNDVNRALSSLTQDQIEAIDIETALEEIVDLWDGVCNIDLLIPAQLITSLNEDPQAAHCVNEFVKECVNNAIKHGNSTQIEVNVSPAGQYQIEVSVTNNGQVTQANYAGLGTRILDEITTHWSRSQTPSGTMVVGQIPIQAELVKSL
jgi:signal transduction histidine kinase